MKQALLISTIIILNGLNAQDVILDFESEDDAIIVENDQLPSGSNPRTLEAWINPGNEDGHYNVAYYGGDGCCGKHFGISATTSTVYAFVGGAQRGITNIDLDGWHHVAFVLPENEDRTYKIKVFLDGVQMAIDHTVGDNYTINTEGSALEIGGSGFTGQIKQIRLWSAELSEEEISANKDIAHIPIYDDNYDKLVYQLQEEEVSEDNSIIVVDDDIIIEDDDIIIEDDAMIVLEFNSEDDAIIVENDQLPSGSNPRTLEAWVYPENSEGDPNVAYYGGGNGVGKHFGIRATTSTVYAFLGGAQRGITNLSLVGWHHVAFVLPENEDRTNKIKVFLDGVQMAIDHTVGDNYTINTGGSALEIGGSGFTGQIKQIRLWSAELSEEEISANKYIAYISSDDDNYDKLVYQLQEEEATFRIFGTAGNDFLEGSGEKDFIYGLDGDDEIHGGEGHDRMYGGTGDDVFYSGFGKDVIWGGDGYDTVHFPGKKKNYIKNQHSDHWVIKKGDGSKKTRIYDCELAVFKNGKTKSLE